MGTFDIQRVPPGQQAVNLKAPRHEQHRSENIGFNLGNIDWLGLLIDAAFHALVTNPMPRAGTHRVVDNHQGQGSDVVALLFQQMHLGDFFFQRATGDSHAQRVDFVSSILFVPHAFRAGIRVAVMAVNAVIDFIQHPAVAKARVGEGEALSAPLMFRVDGPCLITVMLHGFMLYQMREVGFFRHFETDPIGHFLFKAGQLDSGETPPANTFKKRSNQARIVLRQCFREQLFRLWAGIQAFAQRLSGG